MASRRLLWMWTARTVRVAVAPPAWPMPDALLDPGESPARLDYHFIEIMACPGGCVNGGGQP